MYPIHTVADSVPAQWMRRCGSRIERPSVVHTPGGGKGLHAARDAPRPRGALGAEEDVESRTRALDDHRSWNTAAAVAGSLTCTLPAEVSKVPSPKTSLPAASGSGAIESWSSSDRFTTTR